MFKGVCYKGRSVWKGLYFPVFKKDYFYSSNKILRKSFNISDLDVGFTYKIYNGRFFSDIFVSKRAHGCKFGQFVVTKKGGKSIHLRSIENRKRKR